MKLYVIMCVVEVRICPECRTRVPFRFVPCENGMRGFVCVGPNTPSGVPFLSISTNFMTGRRVADLTTIVPSHVIMLACRSCNNCSNDSDYSD